ncbi:MAG: glycosyltransferase family 9 protein, partial [Candidatus Omnitrophica bacterium]|nr:glycosyltransferase family 9 protein [Candidatus Omnitrophota bacterium]
RNILIAHLEGMGDNILSIPLLHNIRVSLRNAHLDLLIPKGRADIYHNQKLNRIFEYRGTWPQQMLDTPYDAVFDLNTSYTPYSYIYQIKYERLICFKKCVQLENEISLSWVRGVPAWKLMLNLLTLTDMRPPYRQDYAFFISEANLKFARFIQAGIDSDKILCIVPGAGGQGEKKWSPRHFSQLIDYLHETFSDEIVLVGHWTERGLGEQIENMLSFGITNLIGMTSIGTLAALLRDARLLISNDTGTMHIAGILNTPVIALFGPTNPKEYGPLGDNHRLIVSDTKEMNGISVDRVINACCELLTEVS